MQINPKGKKKGKKYVSRGESWFEHARECRPAYRYRFSTDFQYSYLGFRLVLVSGRIKR